MPELDIEQQTEKTIEGIEEAEDKAFSDAFAEASEPKDGDDLQDDEADEEIGDEQDGPEDTEGSSDQLSELEKLRKERDNYLHQFESNKGRITSYQQQINNLQSQLSSYVSKGSTQQQAQEELAQQVNDSSWEELKEDFPEIAQALDQKLSSINQKVEELVGQRIGQIEQQIQPLTQRASEDALMQEYAALEAAHPDYRDIADSADFNKWLESKPEPVKKLVESNSAADAAYLLDTFKAESGANSEQKRLQNKQQNRERLQANLSVPSNRIVRREVSDDDFSSAFDSAVAKQNRSRR